MTALVVGTAATWGMVGLIWMVQVVHYPMLGRISAHEPATAALDHQRRISWVVGPLMAVEGVTALILLASRPETMSAAAAWSAATLLGIALLSTVALQVPLHGKLAAGHDDEVIQQLLATNWIRTVAWTARGVLLTTVLLT